MLASLPGHHLAMFLYSPPKIKSLLILHDFEGCGAVGHFRSCFALPLELLK